jgi:hypothetical protein
MIIDAYFIDGYQWLLYYKLFLVIICYIISIIHYFIVNYFFMLCVIIS